MELDSGTPRLLQMTQGGSPASTVLLNQSRGTRELLAIGQQLVRHLCKIAVSKIEILLVKCPRRHFNGTSCPADPSGNNKRKQGATGYRTAFDRTLSQNIEIILTRFAVSKKFEIRLTRLRCRRLTFYS